ncbi:acetyltransferase [Brevibacillus choshinensis]|uniref:Acetyltransferase n=1 Tax=Brevibacillus choshinensis TaxID=54911 RepID=A0ABR5NFA1_BRECH|nr:GNAT family protein [Brevibacillus choshinensis]KQL50221.1 acetyltransferase [Brevibacillus choshinensis]
MDFPFVKTARLHLVKIEEKHAPSLFEILSKEEVTKYYGMDPLTDVNHAMKLVESFQNIYESERGIRWGIECKETGAFVGTVGLNNLSMRSKRAEIGYEIHPHFWNQGITSEAVREVLRYAFEDLDLLRMGAITFLQNEASIHLLKKAGFSLEGTLRSYLYQNQQSHDALIFSLLKTEWLVKRK